MGKFSECDFLEIHAGCQALTVAVGSVGLRTGEPVDKLYPAYGHRWGLSTPDGRARLAYLVVQVLHPKAVHLGTPCTEMCVYWKARNVCRNERDDEVIFADTRTPECSRFVWVARESERVKVPLFARNCPANREVGAL